jgi:hypothetical protein
MRTASKRQRRAVLTPQLAREIFSLRFMNSVSNSRSASKRVGAKYQVSPKTVRDIWKGRCWLAVTSDLWDDDEDRPQAKTKGRPKGKRDSKPRHPKSMGEIPSVETEGPFAGARPAQDATDPLRNPSAIYSPGTAQRFSPTLQLTHQMPRTGETILEGFNSLTPGSCFMPSMAYTVLAGRPCFSALGNLALDALEFNSNEKVHPYQRQFIEPKPRILPLPATSPPYANICLPMPACFLHSSAATCQRGASGAHMMPLDRPWLPCIDRPPCILAPIMMPSTSTSAGGGCGT